MTHEELTKLLHQEMLPATGCTGPTAYALAAAAAKPYLTADVKEIKVYVSPAYLKIGFGVATPGTPQPGIETPTAIGLLAGDAKLGLQVLTNVTDADIKEAAKIVDSGIIRVMSAPGKQGVYIRDEITTANETVTTVVEHMHDNITLIKVNNDVKFEGGASASGEEPEERLEDHPDRLKLADIFEYVKTAELDEVKFLLDGYKMNLALAEDGLKGGFGLKTGRALLRKSFLGKEEPKDLFENPMKYMPTEITEKANILVSAASDGRMGGSRLPAMAAMGDGNQGLTAMIPVGVAGELMGKDDLEIARAIALSCLMLFFVKMNIGRASAICLCAIAASAGVAAGVSYLRGYDENTIKAAVKNCISPLTGMLCDGAKNACAMKMSIAANTAIVSADMAGYGVEAGFYDGVCDDTLEQTVACICKIATRSMDMLDGFMVDAIEEKSERKFNEKKN